MKSDPSGGYQCPDAIRHVCTSPKDAQSVYNKGCSMRATASTKMNDSSSRSHALLQISVAWVEQRGKSFAQLNLVDLAGSEGMKKTGAEGEWRGMRIAGCRALTTATHHRHHTTATTPHQHQPVNGKVGVGWSWLELRMSEKRAHHGHP